MRYSNLDAPGWTGARVAFADNFLERLVGMRGRAGRDGLMLRARSVHTIGMSRPIGVFAMDAFGKVIMARQVAPNRLVVSPRAAYIVELPHGIPLPALGAEIESTNE